MNSRCAACKYLRRRCPSDCIFSPYFPSNNPQRFATVHRIYGASNIGKMLQLGNHESIFIFHSKQIPPHLRAEAANSMYYEAQCRLADPVYGCVKTISLLHQQIQNAHAQLAQVQAEIAFFKAQMHGGNQIQNAQFPAPSFNYYFADQGYGSPHPTPPASSQPPWFN